MGSLPELFPYEAKRHKKTKDEKTKRVRQSKRFKKSKRLLNIKTDARSKLI